MVKVINWESVAQSTVLGRSLEFPDSKLQEIKQQSYTNRDRSCLAGEYWVKTAPDASWRKLARVLYKQEENRALATVKQYLPKGMCIS